MKNSHRAIALLLAAAGLTACSSLTGSREPLLTEAEVGMAGNDAANTCLIVGGFTNVIGGMYDQITVRMDTANGPKTATIKQKGMLELTLPYVFFQVPKGDYKVTWVSLNLYTGKQKYSKPELELTTFGTPAGSELKSSYPGTHGEINAEMKGTCDGGFKWLGLYEYKRGGLFSSSSLTRKTGFESTERPNFVASLKEQFKGTKWEETIK